MALSLVRRAVFGLVLTTSFALAGCGGVTVKDVNVAHQPAGITVVGHGEVSARPDIARATIGVETSAPTVGEAMKEANARMTAIVAALKGVGIEDKDIRTQAFSVNLERIPEYPPSPPVAPLPEPGPRGKAAAPTYESAPAYPTPSNPVYRDAYRVSNTVNVTLRDLTKAGPMFDGAVRAGANTIYGLDFALDDPTALEAEARDKAVANGRARAEGLAKQSGTKLGAVVRVSEIIGGGSEPSFKMAPMAREAAFAPIEVGQIRITADVQIDYAIADEAEQHAEPEDAGE